MFSIRDSLRGRVPASPFLPCAHTTDGFSFRQILTDRTITPSACDLIMNYLHTSFTVDRHIVCLAISAQHLSRASQRFAF
jgi:hypothetical protein